MGYKINGMEFLSGPSGGILTWHERPALAAQCIGDEIGADFGTYQAIILQGSMVLDYDFTLQTMELYRHLHPNALIILSTWEDEDSTQLLRAQQMGVRVVTSKKPSLVGTSNINLQIVSSAAGIMEAKNAKVTHVLKSRTDQRILAPDVLEYLQSLLLSFPIRENQHQSARLIATSLNTFRYRMYGISDMFLYGQFEDMFNYWTPPLDERQFPPNVSQFTNLREFAEWRVCEVYLCTEFLKRTGWEIGWTLRDYWSLLAQRFCIIDAGSLDLFWPKYNMREFRWTNYRLSKFTEVGFRDWTIFYSGLDHIKYIPEERLTRRRSY